MKFVLGGEGSWEWFERMAYDGVIGLFYNDTLGGVLAYLTFGAIIIFAVIGVLTVLKLIIFGGKRRETAEEKWRRTGKL